ncbi:MAG: FAD-dependent oxidoreductase [Saprospiraceae bacterium]|nr:FAD-dependent oxidoreductase [Saprospiraceae bacterium]
MEPSTEKRINIIGGGIYGITAALELSRRGYKVSVFDRDIIPHPDASSTDITKMIRADYGDDELYADLMHEAFQGWDAWNQKFPRQMYHQTGFLLLTSQAMQPDSFERQSLQTMQKKNFPIQQLYSGFLQNRFPSWNAEKYRDGYYNARGGWAESANVVAQLVQMARQAGVQIHEGDSFAHFIEKGNQIEGIKTTSGQVHSASQTIVAAGAWTPSILPELKACLAVKGQPVFHLLPENPNLFKGEVFPGWSADMSKTGWYGFPAQADGVVKIGNHGIGIEKDPNTEIEIPEKYFVALRKFLSESLPALKDAPIVKTRVCMYCDSWDGNFYIDHHPDKPGLLVATGGSGHGFKFAPILGNIIADVLERKPNFYAHRFRWRAAGQQKFEAARSTNF